MSNKSPKSRSSGVESIKLMIVAISLTATLLFWAVFSAHDQRDLIGETQNLQTAWDINLPPIPTVVSANNEEENPADGSQPSTPLRSVTEPDKKYAVPQEGPMIISSGGNSGGGNAVTSTKAS